jgi:hypothetical protein
VKKKQKKAQGEAIRALIGVVNHHARTLHHLIAEVHHISNKLGEEPLSGGWETAEVSEEVASQFGGRPL